MLGVGGRYVLVGQLETSRPHVVLVHDLQSQDPNNRFRVMKRVHQSGLKFTPDVINEPRAMKLMSGKEGFLTFYELYHQEIDSSYWIVMECAEGGSVLDYLTNFPALHRSMSEPINDIYEETEGETDTSGMSHSARKNPLRRALKPTLRRIFKKKEKEIETETVSSEIDGKSTINISPDVSVEELVEYKTSDEISMDLFAFVESSGVISKYVSPIVVFTIFNQMARCVQRLHGEGLAHMDIKLCNFFMRKYPNDICLGDFGFIALYKEGFVQDIAKGTYMYAAPEVYSGPYDPQKADVWSLGVCLYVMAHNAIPFCGDNQEQTRRAILTKHPILGNSLVDDLLRAMLTKDPEKRPVMNQVLSHPWMQQTPMRRLPAGQPSFIQQMIKDYSI